MSDPYWDWFKQSAKRQDGVGELIRKFLLHARPEKRHRHLKKLVTWGVWLTAMFDEEVNGKPFDPWKVGRTVEERLEPLLALQSRRRR